MFVTGRPFQSSLMFATKAVACQSEAPFRVSSWPYPQTIDKPFQPSLMVVCKAESLLL